MSIASYLNMLLGRQTLNPYESLVLDVVQSKLGEDASALFREQIDSVNTARRIMHGKEVNLYKPRLKSAFDASLNFPQRAKEELLATITLSRTDMGRRLKAEVWLVQGHVFSIIFSAPPKPFFEGKSQPEVEKVRIWFDPMSPAIAPREQQAEALERTGWLAGWCGDPAEAIIRAPLSPAQRSGYLERFDAAMPADYLELVAQTEGLQCGRYTILGASEIRSAVGQETNYYVLAEIEGVGVLVVKAGRQDGAVFALSYEDDSESPMGTSLLGAATKLLREAQ